MINLENKNTQRIFIAVPISESVLQYMREQIAPYKNTPWVKLIRWYSLENLHLTLRFLGDTEISILDKIILQSPPFIQNIRALEVVISAPQPFPSANRPRVIASIALPNENLDALANQIDDCIADLIKIQRDRHFRGHITVGRYRRVIPRTTVIFRNDSTTTLPITKVVVYKSELLPSGAQHTPLLVVNLLE